jgi:hypothetical protein
MIETYETQIMTEINQLVGKDIYGNFEKLPSLSEEKSKLIIVALLRYACCCAHNSPIIIARNMLSSLPHDWIADRIRLLSSSAIDFSDDWDYRRLLELAQIISDDLLNWVIEQSIGSDSVEILEAANDFRLDSQT